MDRGGGIGEPGGEETAPALRPASLRRSDVAAFRASLASLDGGGLTDRERVDAVAELERVKGACAAAQARLVDALRVSREAVDARDVARSVGSQVALARRCSLKRPGFRAVLIRAAPRW